MIILVKVKFPIRMAQRVTEVYLKVTNERPVPEGITHIGPFFKTTLEDSGAAISFYDVEKGKEIEAYKYAVEMESPFRVIEGYRYTVDLYYTVEESLALPA